MNLLGRLWEYQEATYTPQLPTSIGSLSWENVGTVQHARVQSSSSTMCWSVSVMVSCDVALKKNRRPPASG